MDGVGDQLIKDALDALRQRLEAGKQFHIGFPGAMDFDYEEVLPFFAFMINNIGDPYTDPAFPNHTKDFEREVLEFFACLFAAPRDGWSGHVTAGSTESIVYALREARTRLPAAPVYFSESAHYSVAKAVELLGLKPVKVRSMPSGEMDYAHLGVIVRQRTRRRRPVGAIVVASVGTTMTEAVDDVDRIRSVVGAGRPCYVHSDAALAGVPLALLEPHDRPPFDLSHADSVSFSGHKFIGCPFPSGVVLLRSLPTRRRLSTIAYTGAPDTTISGSRNGHATLLMWYAIRTYGVHGLRRRANEARAVAAYALGRLEEIGWPAWRNPWAFTVVIRTPPPDIAAQWTLTDSSGWSHVICMPGVTREQIDRFIVQLERLATPPGAAVSGPPASATTSDLART